MLLYLLRIKRIKHLKDSLNIFTDAAASAGFRRQNEFVINNEAAAHVELLSNVHIILARVNVCIFFCLDAIFSSWMGNDSLASFLLR